MTDEEREKVQRITEGWRHEPHVVCPSCGTTLGVRLRVTAGAVVIDDTGAVQAPEPITVEPVGSPLELQLIADAEQSGLLGAFETAVKAANPNNVPTDVGKFLVIFLKTCRAKKMPRFVVDRYIREMSTEQLEFWSAQGVVAVVGDKVIRAFVPLSYLLGTPMYGIGDAIKGRLAVEPEKLELWVRGRFGYVPAKSKAFLSAMQRKSLGDFNEFVQ